MLHSHRSLRTVLERTFSEITLEYFTDIKFGEEFKN
jgi:hypothetical protein